MTSDPHRDPTPGDHLAQQGDLFPVPGETIRLGGALRWVVVAREPAHVVFRVAGMEKEPPRRIGIKQWQRVAVRATR